MLRGHHRCRGRRAIHARLLPREGDGYNYGIRGGGSCCWPGTRTAAAAWRYPSARFSLRREIRGPAREERCAAPIPAEQAPRHDGSLRGFLQRGARTEGRPAMCCHPRGRGYPPGRSSLQAGERSRKERIPQQEEWSQEEWSLRPGEYSRAERFHRARPAALRQQACHSHLPAGADD